MAIDCTISFIKDNIEFGYDYLCNCNFLVKKYNDANFERWDFFYPRTYIFYVYSKNICLCSNGIKSSIWRLFIFNNKLQSIPYLLQHDVDKEENCVTICRNHDEMTFSTPATLSEPSVKKIDYSLVNNTIAYASPKREYKYNFQDICNEIYKKYESDFSQIGEKEYFKNEIYRKIYFLFQNKNMSFDEVIEYFDKNIRQMIKSQIDSEKKYLHDSAIMEKINAAITNSFLEQNYIFKNENFDTNRFQLLVDEVRERVWLDTDKITDSTTMEELKSQYLRMFSDEYHNEEIYDEIFQRYTLEYIMQKYEKRISKIKDIDSLKIRLQDLLSYLKDSFSDYDCTEIEIEWNREIKDCINQFIEDEKQEYLFIKKYGTNRFVVEITEEKEKIFNNPRKSRQITNQQLKKEFEIYKQLVATYNHIYYNKKTNQLIPTMKKTDDLVNYFNDIIDAALETKIIVNKDDIYEFQSFDNAENFVKRLYEIDKIR